MNINDILKDHGFGSGGLNPYFGTGADGAFAPAQLTNVGTLSVGAGSNPGYTSTSSTPYPTTAYANALACGVLIPGGAGVNNLALMSPQVGTTGIAAGQSYGSDISPSTTITISAIDVYFGSSGTAQASLYDDTAGTTLFQSGGIGIGGSGGWVQFSFPSPITLTAGKNYRLSMQNAGSTTITVGTAGASAQNVAYNYVQQSTVTFTSTTDGPPIVKNFTSVNIPAGTTVTVSNRCQGLIILCQGDVVINGQIKMDGLGAIIDPTTTAGYTSIEKAAQLYIPNSSSNNVIVIGPGGSGGSGGYGGSAAIESGTGGGVNPTLCGGNPGRGSAGTWWGGGQGGGGGGGSAVGYTTGVVYQGGAGGGNGGNANYTINSTGGVSQNLNTTASSTASGSSGSGGSGGGGAGWAITSSSSYTATATTGTGGNQGSGAGGGGGSGGIAVVAGSGNANNASSQPTPPSTGATAGPGGLILIVCSGAFTLSSGATLSAKGSTAGGVGGNANWQVVGTGLAAAGGGGGGGGAGGGIIAALAKGTLTNSGICTAVGAAGGSGGTGGGTVSGGISNYVPIGYNGQSGLAGASGRVQMVQL